MSVHLDDDYTKAPYKICLHNMHVCVMIIVTDVVWSFLHHKFYQKDSVDMIWQSIHLLTAQQADMYKVIWRRPRP